MKIILLKACLKIQGTQREVKLFKVFYMKKRMNSEHSRCLVISMEQETFKQTLPCMCDAFRATSPYHYILRTDLNSSSLYVRK